MPIVPTDNQRRVDVRPAATPLQQIRTTPDDFGAGQGRAMMQVGAGLEKVGAAASSIVEEEQRKDDVARVLDAQAKLDTFQRDRLYGEGGIMTRTGERALGAQKEIEAGFAKFGEEVGGTLTNPKQREAWARIFQGAKSSTLDRVASYENTQRTQWKVASANAGLTAATELAFANPLDDGIAGETKDKIRKIIGANEFGAPAQEIENKIAAGVSSMHAGRIKAVAVNNPIAARELLIKVAPEITGGDRAALDAYLERPLEKANAEAKAGAIVGNTPSAAARSIAANSHGIDMSRLMGTVIPAESSGDPTALSDKGAAGLTQVIPGTARMISQRLGDGLFSQKMTDAEVTDYLRDPKNANVAVLYGSHEYDRLLGKYNGDLTAAAIGYHAGEGKADEWLKGGRDWSLVGPKTRAYADKIVSRYADGQGGGSGDGGGKPSVAAEISAGGFPQAGVKATRENWDQFGFQFYKPQDFMAPSAGGQWVDARSAKMADELGRRFFAETGVKVGINDDHDFSGKGGTGGKRRGTADPSDNPHVENSQHVQGRAFDFQVQNLTPEQKGRFLAMARELGFTGVGFYDGGGKAGHLHLDTGKARWWGQYPAWASGSFVPSRAGDPAGVPAGGRAMVPTDGRAPVSVNADAIGPIAASTGILSPGAVPSAAIGATVKPMPDIQAWREQVEAIPDLEERRRVSAIVEGRISALQRQGRDEFREVAREAFREIQTGKQVHELSPEILQAINDQNPKLLETLESLADKKAKGKEVATDWGLYHKLRTMPEEDLVDVNLVEHFDRLGKTEREALLDRQDTIKNRIRQDANAEAKTADARRREDRTKGFRSIDEVMKVALTAANIDTTKPEGAARAGLLYKRLEEHVGDWKEAHKGETPIGADLDKIVERLMRPINAGAWTGSTKYFFEAGTPEENAIARAAGRSPMTEERFKAVSKLAEIPPGDLATLADRFRAKAGRLPKEPEAIETYNRALTVLSGRYVEPPAPDRAEIKREGAKRLGRELTDEEVLQTYAMRIGRHIDPAFTPWGMKRK